jgi:hypothetical protein
MNATRSRDWDEVVGEEAIEGAANELKAIERKVGLQRSVAIGKVVVTLFFDGDVSRWRDQRRNKSRSIRRLASHPSCPFSRSALNQAVGVCAIVSMFPEVADYEHVGATHVAATLHVPVDKQRAWLRIAEQEQLSVRELKARLAEDLPGGQRNASPLKRALNELGRLESTLEELMDLETPLPADAWEPILDRLRILQSTVLKVARARPSSIVEVCVDPACRTGELLSSTA